ncbi:MAG: transcriptional regulator, partial [Prevotellaceae bacterium]|nr:transcriptional regulator [Prevotellaceae bacterium]
MTIPNVPISELKQETFEFFKTKDIESNHLSESNHNDTPKQVLNNLKLTDKNNLKRATLLRFHPDHETFVTGAFIKNEIAFDKIHKSVYQL